MGAYLSNRSPHGPVGGSGNTRIRTYSTAAIAQDDSSSLEQSRSIQNRSAVVRSRSRSLDIFNVVSANLPSDDSATDDDNAMAAVASGSGPSDDFDRQNRRQRNVFGSRVLQQRHYAMPLSFYRSDIKCPVCNKMIPHDDIELHLIQCLTKPRINYNEDVLTEDKGECAICFEDLCQGDTIARLPCLCIYHKRCIDEWFSRSWTCPEHPGDD